MHLSCVFVKPDEVLERWLTLREQLGSPGSSSLVVDKGLLFSLVCGRCGADATQRAEERHHKTGASRWICARCKAPWNVTQGFLLANEFDSHPRAGAHDARYAELGTYAKILAELSVAQQRVYLLLYLHEAVGNYQAVADETNRRWPTMRPKNTDRWTEWTVRRVISDSRRKILHGLHARNVVGFH